MYEYRVQTFPTMAPPVSLIAPKGFRLRDMQFTEVSRSQVNSVSFGGQNATPYSLSSMATSNGQWVVIWERYVPEEDEE